MEFIEIAAAAIIDKLKSLLDKDVAVTDLAGNVVADSEMKYFGKHLPAAATAIQQNNTVKVSAQQLEDDEPGWATPLVYDKAMVGSLVIKHGNKITEDQVPLARSLAELLIHQVMVLRVLPSTSQVLDKFFHDLLEESQENREKSIEQSRFLDAHYYQTRLESSRIIIFVNIKGFWQKTLGANIVLTPEENSKIANYKEQLLQMTKQIAAHAEDILVLYFSGDNFIILIGENKDPEKFFEKIQKEIRTLHGAIKTKLGEEAKISLAPFYPGLDGFIESYQEGKVILSLGQKLFPQNEVYLPNDMLVARLLSGIPKKDQKMFVQYYLNGVLQESSLLTTLNAYFAADLNLKETARNLNIHKNTLYYRFEKIRKQIGLDPRSFHNAVKLSLALLIHQMSTEEKTDSAQRPKPTK